MPSARAASIFAGMSSRNRHSSGRAPSFSRQSWYIAGSGFTRAQSQENIATGELLDPVEPAALPHERKLVQRACSRGWRCASRRRAARGPSHHDLVDAGPAQRVLPLDARNQLRARGDPAGPKDPAPVFLGGEGAPVQLQPVTLVAGANFSIDRPQRDAMAAARAGSCGRPSTPPKSKITASRWLERHGMLYTPRRIIIASAPAVAAVRDRFLALS